MLAVDLGIIDYGQALDIHTRAHQLRSMSWKEDILFVMEHKPVLTMGKRGGDDDLLVTESELIERDIPLYRLNRGGKITCHYPGQLVAYPVMGVEKFQGDIPRFVYMLEDVIIQTLAAFGAEGRRIPEHRGVFVGSDKIASIGIEVRQNVTMHGISLNVLDDLRLYNLFIPCGIRDKGVTSLEKVCSSGVVLSRESVKLTFLSHFARAFREDVPTLIDRDEFEKHCLKAWECFSAKSPQQSAEIIFEQG